MNIVIGFWACLIDRSCHQSFCLFVQLVSLNCFATFDVLVALFARLSRAHYMLVILHARLPREHHVLIIWYARLPRTSDAFINSDNYLSLVAVTKSTGSKRVNAVCENLIIFMLLMHISHSIHLCFWKQWFLVSLTDAAEWRLGCLLWIYWAREGRVLVPLVLSHMLRWSAMSVWRQCQPIPGCHQGCL